MSFSLSVPVLARADFPAAVDAAIASPQPGTDEQQVIVAYGKGALVAALEILGPENEYVSGTLSGHACGEPGSWPYDSLTVAINGQPAPAVPTPTPVTDAVPVAETPQS